MERKTYFTLFCLVALVSGLFLVFNKDTTVQEVQKPTTLQKTPVTVPDNREVATLAGGCFWCVEAVFQETAGVDSVISGYAGGQESNPTYEQVYTGSTGHREAIQIVYDPAVLDYTGILDIFWRSIDPTDAGGQFVDRGFAYTTAVFYHDNSQKVLAQSSIAQLETSDTLDNPVVTQLLPFTTFYEAEEYHQDYYLKAPERYKSYESASGRNEYKARTTQ